MLAGLRRQWPLAVSLGVVVVGLLVVASGHFRRGTVVLAFGVTLALFLRLLLPSARPACSSCGPSGSTSPC